MFAKNRLDKLNEYEAISGIQKGLLHSYTPFSRDNQGSIGAAQRKAEKATDTRTALYIYIYIYRSHTISNYLPTTLAIYYGRTDSGVSLTLTERASVVNIVLCKNIYHV